MVGDWGGSLGPREILLRICEQKKGLCKVCDKLGAGAHGRPDNTSDQK